MPEECLLVFFQSCDDENNPKIARHDSTCRPKSIEEGKKATADNDEDLEENLTCSICQVHVKTCC